MSSSDSKKRPEPAGAQQTQRADERMPVQLRVRLKYKDVGTFIEKFALNVSRGGMFLASKQVKEIGTVLRFELQLADGQPAIKGEGRVVWNRTAESNGPQTETTGVGSNVSVGMGIKFTRVDPKSRAVLKQCLENRSKMVDRGASFPVPAHVDLDTPEAPELMDLLPPIPAELPPISSVQAPPSDAHDVDEVSRLANDCGYDDQYLGAVLERLRSLRTETELLTAAGAAHALKRDTDITESIEEATAALSRIIGGVPVLGSSKTEAAVKSTAAVEPEVEASTLSPPPLAFAPSSELDSLPSTGMLVIGPTDATAVRFPSSREMLDHAHETPRRTQVQGFPSSGHSGSEPEGADSDGVRSLPHDFRGRFNEEETGPARMHQEYDSSRMDFVDSEDRSDFGQNFTREEAAVFEEGLTNPVPSPTDESGETTETNGEPTPPRNRPSFFRRLLRR